MYHHSGGEAVILDGASVAWTSLVHEGTEVVFGIPGGTVIPLYHVMPDYPVRHVLVRHEQAAVHAADGYARATGNVGVCLVTSGPGATNLITGLATAYSAASAVVAITGQSPTAVIGTDAFQEVDIASITEAVTKHNYLVTNVGNIAQAIKEAFYIAQSGQPGPVLVTLATDILLHEMAYLHPGQVHLPGYDPLPKQRQSAQEADSADQAATGQEHSDEMLRTVMQQICSITQGKIAIVVEPGYEAKDLGGCQPRTLVAPGRMGTKGFALPAAVGVQIGLPDEQVWVVSGDDGLQVTIQELATVVQENLPIRIAVVNRGSTGKTCRGRFEAERGAGPSAGLLGPDFVKLAEAYQIPGLRATRESEFGSAVTQAVATRGPVLIDFQFE
jgi:thiamine pyrophosphate-dependent acetolactate synthase large subunit-like protein